MSVYVLTLADGWFFGCAIAVVIAIAIAIAIVIVMLFYSILCLI